MANAIVLFPCTDLHTTVAFYQALGFAVTHQQDTPYLYGAVHWQDVDLHFSSLRVYGAKNAFGACLVFVPNVAHCHHTFAAALRQKYGKIPTAGFPRITRFRQGDTRFKLFDPTGNLLIFIDHHEPDTGYQWSEEEQTPLRQALENAVFLRDTYANDDAAAKVLDKALQKNLSGTPLDRARVIAARAELAVALGDAAGVHTFQQALQQIPLTAVEREAFRDELQAASNLARWLTEPMA